MSADIKRASVRPHHPRHHHPGRAQEAEVSADIKQAIEAATSNFDMALSNKLADAALAKLVEKIRDG